jgi:hypothetical protein
MVAAFLLLALVSKDSEPASESAVPLGFRAAKEPEIFRELGDEEFPEGYMVSLDGDRVRAETRTDWVKRIRAEAKSRPKPKASVTIPNGDSAFLWSHGQGVQVEDGWIAGYSSGEWGGGLFWLGPKGSPHKRISDRNTSIVAKTSKGIFAVQALAHMVFSYAALVEVRRGQKGWETHSITDLHVSPSQVLQEGDRLVYVAGEFVSTLETNGTQREIYRALSEIAARSMVRRANGQLWIGSLHGLLSLTPRPDGQYKAQWYVPASEDKKGGRKPSPPNSSATP